MHKDNLKILKEKLDQAVETAIDATKKEKKKPVRVYFDKNSNAPWDVLFSERGFLVGETRLSFEEIKNALSKNYNIVLDKGNGLILDAVKMQSILKYEDRV